MIRPCPTRIDCENDNPFVNLSSEGLEANIPPWVPPIAPYWRLFGYCCDSTVVQATSTEGLIQAQDLLAAALVNECPDCGPPQTFCAQANCPDGTNLTEICVPTSQADADLLAAAAELAMQPFCGDTSALFNATCACPDGSNSQTVFSNVSEAVAQAQCDTIPRICPNACNTPQTCTIFCPDGTEFTYTIPACVVYAATVAEADALAHALACQRAEELRVCLGPAQLCACQGQSYSTRITATGAPRPPLSWSITSGTLPTGLVLAVSGDTLSVTISGTPTAFGTFTFRLRATMAGPTFAERTYQIRVIAISTTSIPGFTVGSLYTFQMQAVGGSGNYAWTITSGTLPDGLVLNSSGLILGTPTGAGGGGNITFEVIDLSCESLNRGFFVPRISLQTTSLTQIRTHRGWPVWTGADTTLYKRATFSGFMRQIAFPNYNDPSIDAVQCAGARYEFSGSSAIDIFGNHTSIHSKILTSMCTEPFPAAMLVQIDASGIAHVVINQFLLTMLGYCWSLDPESCEDCLTDEAQWSSMGDFAIFGAPDIPNSMLLGGNTAASTPTVKTYQGSDLYNQNAIIQPGRVGFPTNNGFGVYEDKWPFVLIISNGNWSVALSEPYTDAEAMLSQQQYVSNGRVAENTPNYITSTYQTVVRRSSRITTVQYALNCSNLVPDQAYIARIDLVDSTGAKTTVDAQFTATATTHTVVGTVPLPAAGHTTAIKNPRIIFA